MYKHDIWKHFNGINNDKSIIRPIEKKYNFAERLLQSQQSDPIITNLQEIWDCSMHICNVCLGIISNGKEIGL